MSGSSSPPKIGLKLSGSSSPPKIGLENSGSSSPPRIGLRWSRSSSPPRSGSKSEIVYGLFNVFSFEIKCVCIYESVSLLSIILINLHRGSDKNVATSNSYFDLKT